MPVPEKFCIFVGMKQNGAGVVTEVELSKIKVVERIGMIEHNNQYP